MVASYLGLKDAEVESKLVSRDFGQLASQLGGFVVVYVGKNDAFWRNSQLACRPGKCHIQG